MNEVKYINELIFDFEYGENEAQVIICHPVFWRNLTKKLFEYTIVGPNNLKYMGIRICRCYDVKEDEVLIF